MQEIAPCHQGNKKGLRDLDWLRICVSDKSHSAIDRVIWIPIIGQENLFKLPVVGD